MQPGKYSQNQCLKQFIGKVDYLVNYIYNQFIFTFKEQCPCVSNACQITADVMEDIRPYALMIEECRELYAILSTPHIRVSK